MCMCACYCVMKCRCASRKMPSKIQLQEAMVYCISTLINVITIARDHCNFEVYSLKKKRKVRK